jgi:hypothetical protein
LVRPKQFSKELLIPLLVEMPMLHGVSDIGSLDQMLNDNRSLEIQIVFLVSVGPFPTLAAEFLQVFIKDISHHNCIDHQTPELMVLFPLAKMQLRSSA